MRFEPDSSASLRNWRMGSTSAMHLYRWVLLAERRAMRHANRSRSRGALRWGVPVNSSAFSDLPQHSAECNRLLGLPRIALLFLSRGPMYHEETWAKWFAGAAGLIPKPTLQVGTTVKCSCLVRSSAIA